MPKLPYIAIPWIYFVAMSLFVLVAWFLSGLTFVQICRWLYPDFPITSEYAQFLCQGVSSIVAIAAALYAKRFLGVMETMPHIAIKKIGLLKPPPPISLPAAFAVGAGVFIIVRTILIPVSLGWDWLLDILRVPVADQDLVQLFRNETSAQRLALLVFIAAVIAPVFEEIIFRGALFGYCRARMPRWLAIVLPSLIFAAVHMDKASGLPNMRSVLPLFLLAVIFSIAYERTGRIIVPIVAHGLFNLSTIVLILLGVQN